MLNVHFAHEMLVHQEGSNFAEKPSTGTDDRARSSTLTHVQKPQHAIENIELVPVSRSCSSSNFVPADSSLDCSSSSE